MLQAEGSLPPTFGRVASFAEQGMAKNVPLREMHPVQSLLSYIKQASIFYSKQVKLCFEGNALLFIERSLIYVTDSNSEFTLTPYARKHLEQLKIDANKYTVDIIKDDEYTVWKFRECNTPHIVNWSSKSCSNCHFYAENLLPCVHLYAVWIHHKTVGVRTKCEAGEWRLITRRDEAYDHLFGKCYHLSTLRYIIENVSSVRPVSIESISHDENLPNLALQKKACRGRPQTKRLASNCDNFATGKVQKHPRRKVDDMQEDKQEAGELEAGVQEMQYDVVYEPI